ncbi:MAG: hypothetical protein AABX72_01810 [Nanoarchaeota archaeon]
MGIKQATRFKQGSPMTSTEKATKRTSKAKGQATPKTTFGGSS